MTCFVLVFSVEVSHCKQLWLKVRPLQFLDKFQVIWTMSPCGDHRLLAVSTSLVTKACILATLASVTKLVAWRWFYDRSYDMLRHHLLLLSTAAVEVCGGHHSAWVIVSHSRQTHREERQKCMSKPKVFILFMLKVLQVMTVALLTVCHTISALVSWSSWSSPLSHSLRLHNNKTVSVQNYAYLYYWTDIVKPCYSTVMISLWQLLLVSHGFWEKETFPRSRKNRTKSSGLLLLF